jgi:single-strand DNA-binding protein
MRTDINNFTFTGRFTDNPELKTFDRSDAKLCTFSIATNYYQGKGKENGVSFIECQAWNKGGEIIAEYMRKGSKITISGMVKQERWQDKTSGKARSKLIVVVDQFSFGGDNKTEPNAETQNRPEARVEPQSTSGSFEVDEVPF